MHRVLDIYSNCFCFSRSLSPPPPPPPPQPPSFLCFVQRDFCANQMFLNVWVLSDLLFFSSTLTLPSFFFLYLLAVFPPVVVRCAQIDSVYKKVGCKNTRPYKSKHISLSLAFIVSLTHLGCKKVDSKKTSPTRSVISSFGSGMTSDVR